MASLRATCCHAFRQTCADHLQRAHTWRIENPFGTGNGGLPLSVLIPRPSLPACNRRSYDPPFVRSNFARYAQVGAQLFAVCMTSCRTLSLFAFAVRASQLHTKDIHIQFERPGRCKPENGFPKAADVKLPASLLSGFAARISPTLRSFVSEP